MRWGSRDTFEVEVDAENSVLVSSRSTMGVSRGGEAVEKEDKVPEGSTKMVRLLVSKVSTRDAGGHRPPTICEQQHFGKESAHVARPV